MSYLERSYELLGKDKIKSFSSKTILVIGLGGVGGTALEALARSGFKKFVLIDCDVVDETNLNRQILFTKKDIGKSKVISAKNRIKSISNSISCTTIEAKVGLNNLNSLIKCKPSFIIDAIDFVPGKLGIYNYALKNKIPFISSLGMGNRIDPEKVLLTTLNKTENCPLAKKVRFEAKQMGLDLKQINVVFSKEEPLVKKQKPASMMMVPSTAGLLMAKYVVCTIK